MLDWLLRFHASQTTNFLNFGDIPKENTFRITSPKCPSPKRRRRTVPFCAPTPMHWMYLSFYDVLCPAHKAFFIFRATKVVALFLLHSFNVSCGIKFNERTRLNLGQWKKHMLHVRLHHLLVIVLLQVKNGGRVTFQRLLQIYWYEHIRSIQYIHNPHQ